MVFETFFSPFTVNPHSSVSIIWQSALFFFFLLAYFWWLIQETAEMLWSGSSLHFLKFQNTFFRLGSSCVFPSPLTSKPFFGGGGGEGMFSVRAVLKYKPLVPAKDRDGEYYSNMLPKQATSFWMGEPHFERQARKAPQRAFWILM